MPGANTLVEDLSIFVDGTEVGNVTKVANPTRERAASNRTAAQDLHEQQDIGAFTFGMTLEVLQDYDAGKVHSVMAPISRSGEDVAVVIKRKTAAAADDNPSFTYTFWLATYTPERGAFGDQATAECVFENRADETRAVS